MPTSRETRIAIRHARWRWLGAPLLVIGVCELIGAVLSVAVGATSGLTVMLSLFATGLGLASFGANHDTAMAYAARAGSDPALPESLGVELEELRATEPGGVAALRPAPRVALSLPFVAVAVQSLVAWRLVG